jgi:ribonuclease P protein component
MNVKTFGRSERLKSEKAIEALFETGKSLYLQPIRLIFKQNLSAENSNTKVGFAVPKKNFKRAVDRNLLKRRMREAYRLNKPILFPDNSEHAVTMDIMLVYQGQKIEDFTIIKDSIGSLLKKLLQKTERK